MAMWHSGKVGGVTGTIFSGPVTVDQEFAPVAISIEELLESCNDTFTDDEMALYLEQCSRHFNDLIHGGMLQKIKTGEFGFDDVCMQMGFIDKLVKNATVNPQKLIEQQMQLMQDHAKLLQQATLALLGKDSGEVIASARGDTRFDDTEWQTNPIFGYIKQAYLLNAKALQDMAVNMEFADTKAGNQLKFWMRQFSNALAPTNFIATNPAVCRAIVESKGKNLREGFKNFLKDLKQSPENMLMVEMSESDAFVLGENIATSAGAVVYQNELIQLIQYRPQTAAVYRPPLLLVPAFINKYYILDLSPENSFIDWLVKQGFTVFVISWVNPGKSLAHKSFTDYMLEGPIAARNVVAEITGEQTVIGIGYCVGGTLLACAQAYLKARQQAGFASTTYLATLLDFSNPGEIGAYISEEFIAAMEADALHKGVFDGRVARLCFSLLRENNLYWSFFINSYLLGKDPAPLDLLHWNSDSTNVPMAMAAFYLRSMYMGNELVKPGGIVLNDTPIDLTVIDTPAYFLSTQADHIALWEATYLGALVHGGDKRFVLAGSGHIAGVINPPAANKYGYSSAAGLPSSACDWLESSVKHRGSWWPDWLAWSTAELDGRIPARELGTQRYPVLEEAPGSYVKMPAAAVDSAR
jgi:poly[(R)-3-hydroxyalkanoate] polymerase subunit PhaC